MWFAVNLLFESIHNGQSSPENLWEESLFLLEADSRSAAEEQGKLLGQREEASYESATGDQVRWTFRGLESVYAIEADSLEPGTELFSRFLRASEVHSLLTPFQETDQPGSAPANSATS